MIIQNSYDRALKQQGFKTENIHQTAQIAWQEREREALTAICRDFFIDAQHSQGIGKGRKYLTPQEYRRAKDEQQAKIDEELQPLKDELSEYKQLDVSEKAFSVDEKKVPFNKTRISVPTEDLEKLKKQAKAYRVNLPEMQTLRSRKEELDKKENELNERSRCLGEQEWQLEKDKSTLKSNYLTVKEMYNRQYNINKLLEQSELCVSTLTSENNSLNHTIEKQNKTIHELQEQVSKIQTALRGAYESLTNVTKAIGMLKYSDNEYKASLTEQQSRLIDAIANYSERLANMESYSNLAEDIRTHVGISSGIQDELQELMPKKSRGMSL